MNRTYYKLTPSENIEKSEIYFDRLDWALKESDITNIAIMGTYASGKSSIIKSYLRKIPKERLINISLVCFNKSNKLEEKGKNEKTEILEEKIAQDNENLIEKSILQQIFYKADDKKIPYSRFKKIRNRDEQQEARNIIKYILMTFVIIYLGSYIFTPTNRNLDNII